LTLILISSNTSVTLCPRILYEQFHFFFDHHFTISSNSLPRFYFTSTSFILFFPPLLHSTSCLYLGLPCQVIERHAGKAGAQREEGAAINPKMNEGPGSPTCISSLFSRSSFSHLFQAQRGVVTSLAAVVARTAEDSQILAPVFLF